ncbi:MAG: universal stress protein [Casimicrobiaceae bacterium]
MIKILLAVDGSESAVRATRTVVELATRYKEVPHIELATVHRPVPYLGRLSGVVVSKDMVRSYYDEEGERALAPCAKILADAGIPFAAQTLVGEIAQTIVHHAHESGCAMICMGTRGLSAIPGLVLGSVATQVLHVADVPVMLVR